MNSSLWETGQPNDPSGYEYCSAYGPVGALDVQCDKAGEYHQPKFSLVCELNRSFVRSPTTPPPRTTIGGGGGGGI